MKKREYPLGKVYGLLEPGPVVLLTTQKAGTPNVMAQSWHMMLDFEPALVACVVSNRNYSFAALRETKQCVINIPTAKLAREVVSCGNVSGRHVNKFKKFGLTPIAGEVVDVPMIAECYANLECRVVDTRMVRRYGVFVLHVVRAWVDSETKWARTLHHQGKGEFMVAGRRLKLPSKKK